jgi:tripartite motif-containing protein 71
MSESLPPVYHCDLCDHQVVAHQCCSTEDLLLCEVHARNHAEKTATKAHKMISLEERSKWTDIGMAYAKAEIPKCSTHSDMHFEQFCETCLQFVCRNCIQVENKHNGHTVVDISQPVYAAQMTKFNENLKGFCSAEVKVDDSISGIISNWVESIVVYRDKTTSDTKEQFDCVRKDLKRRQQESTVELEKTFSLVNKVVENQIKQADDILKSISVSLHDFEAHLEGNSVDSSLENLIAGRKRIQKALNEIETEKICLFPQTEDSIVFSLDSAYKQRLSSVGSLEERSADWKKTTASGPGVKNFDFKKGRVHFTIKVVDVQGLPCYPVPKDFEISFEDDEKKQFNAEVELSVKERGIIQVIYEHKFEEDDEEFYVSVKLKGEHITGSPFKVCSQVEIEGKFQRKWGGTGSNDGLFSNPWGICVWENEVYVTDYGNNRVQVFDKTGTFVRKFGSAGSGSGGLFRNPEGICSHDGEIYVCDYNGNQIQVFGTDGVFRRRWGTSGSADGQFSGPIGVSASETNLVFVAESGNNRVSVFQRDGTFVRRFGVYGTGNGQLSNPWNVTVVDDEVYVVEYGNCRISVFSLEGEFKRTFGSRGNANGQISNPEDVAISGNEAYVADFANNRIAVFDRFTGTWVRSFGSTGNEDGQLQGPLSLTIADGEMFIAEYYNPQRIHVFA